MKQRFEPETSLEESQSVLFPKSQENTDREPFTEANLGNNMISQESRVSLNSNHLRGGSQPGPASFSLQQANKSNADISTKNRRNIYREKAADQFNGDYGDQRRLG